MSSIESSMANCSVSTWNVANEVLDNELILNMIFDNLIDSCHLTLCRLVCSKWNQLIVKQMEKNIWMNRQILRFGNDKKLQDYINTFASPASPNSLLFSCFSFHGNLDHVILMNFFKTFSQKMKSIHLDYYLKDLEELENILESQDTSLIELKISPRVKNFKKFSIQKKSYGKLCLSNLLYLCLEEHAMLFTDYGYVQDSNEDDLYETDEQNKIHIQLMNFLLSKIPSDNINPKTLPLRIFLKGCSSLTTVVNSLKMFGHVKHLKLIHITRIESGELNILANAGVELERLVFKFHQDYGEDDDLDGRFFTNEFLQTHTNSLEMLKYQDYVFKFPSVMRALKILHIVYTGLVKPDENIEQIPLLYQQYLPNLEILVLRHDTFDMTSEFEAQFFSPQEPSISLKKLSLSYGSVQKECMRRISSMFPNMKSLVLKQYRHDTDYKDNIFFSTIWNSDFAENLEELHLEFSALGRDLKFTVPGIVPHVSLKLNTIFSGVKQDEIGSFYKFLKPKNYEFDESKYNSILNLKNLKKLQIGCVSPQQDPFTDFSAFYIFGNMKKLEVLHLDEDLRQFSPKALEYLKNKKRKSSISQPLVVTGSDYSRIYPNYWDVHIEPYIFNLLDGSQKYT